MTENHARSSAAEYRPVPVQQRYPNASHESTASTSQPSAQPTVAYQVAANDPVTRNPAPATINDVAPTPLDAQVPSDVQAESQPVDPVANRTDEAVVPEAHAPVQDDQPETIPLDSDTISGSNGHKVTVKDEADEPTEEKAMSTEPKLNESSETTQVIVAVEEPVVVPETAAESSDTQEMQRSLCEQLAMIKDRSPQNEVVSDTLHIFNIPQSIDENALRAAFQPFGNIQKIDLPFLEPETDGTIKHREFGFIR
jgi:hypothetical protein